jgi:peptidoglycan-associated lipoprotein
MNLSKFSRLLVLGLVLTIAVAGCKKGPQKVTTLPGAANPRVGAPSESGPILNTPPTRAGDQGDGVSSQSRPANLGSPTEGTPFPTDVDFSKWGTDNEALKSFTVYFDFDSSAVKASEKTKISSVVDYLKGHAVNAVRVEGHCDERGTEEYNRSLGERRALAIREILLSSGVDARRIDTISYGKDRPADPGHNEEAWRKNRRGEFILLIPPATP